MIQISLVFPVGEYSNTCRHITKYYVYIRGLIEQIPAQNARRLSLHDYPDKTSAGDALSWAHAARMFQLKWFKSWIVYPNATSSGYLHVASKQEWLAALWLSWNTSCPLVSWFQPPRWIFWLLHAGKSWLAIDIWDWHTWNLSSSWVAQNRQGNWRGNHWQKMQTLVKHPFPVVNSSALLCFSASFFWVGYKKGHTPWFSDDWIIEKKTGEACSWPIFFWWSTWKKYSIRIPTIMPGWPHHTLILRFRRPRSYHHSGWWSNPILLVKSIIHHFQTHANMFCFVAYTWYPPISLANLWLYYPTLSCIWLCSTMHLLYITRKKAMYTYIDTYIVYWAMYIYIHTYIHAYIHTYI